MSQGAAHCFECGRFVGQVKGHLGYDSRSAWSPGPYLARVTGVCARHGEVEAVREWGWGWDDFEWPKEIDQ